MGKIVSIDGQPIADPENPRLDVIEVLESVLALARHGQIHGVRIAVLGPDGCAGGYAIGLSSYSLLGMMHSMAIDLNAQLSAAEAGE